MSVVININSVQPASSTWLAPPSASARSSPTKADAGNADSVELSQMGRALARAVEESSFRLARVRSIRAEIAAGTYETTERIDGTLSRMLDIFA